MESDDWRRLVDLGRVAAWMDSRGLESGPIEGCTVMTGGTQNILLRFRRGGRQFVLRRPPAHPHLDGTQTMRREARVLAALANTSVPHPGLIASCDDKEVIGAGFYLMEPVDGFTPTVALPDNVAASQADRHRMGMAMIDAIVDLGTVDYVAVGLADFVNLDNYVERQIDRYHRQLESYREYSGWPGPGGLPGLDTVHSWLQANRPRHFAPGIVHGDFSLGNVMFRYDRPELAAIVDWELATLGDPLIDLGWMLALWPDPDGTGLIPKLEVKPWQGFPRAEELVARYAERSGRDMSNMPWFTVLACYKLGILLEGSHARAHAGKAARELGDELHRAARKTFVRALEQIDRP